MRSDSVWVSAASPMRGGLGGIVPPRARLYAQTNEEWAFIGKSLSPGNR